MQTNLYLATKEEIRLAYAFAASPIRRKRQSIQTRNQAIITACSKEARRFGIHTGMRVQEARQLMPDLRILVYGRT